VNASFESPLLHPLLAARFSPACFDPDHRMSPDEVDSLLEAARWAPSAGNSQPWAFIVGLRGDATHARLVRHLAPSSARWAPAAALLVVNVVRRYVEEPGWAYSEFADYDLGQAVAHMTVQAQLMGLACRQFRAFDLDGLSAALDIAPGWQIMTITAVGIGAGGEDARERRPLEDLRSAALGLP
jgi:nitroreductase